MRKIFSVHVIFGVIVALLCVSQAFALDSYTFAVGSTNATNSSGNIGATFSDNTLTLNTSGQFSFASNYGTVADINAINFSGAASEVVLNLPAPIPDQSGQGIGGAWVINWPSQANSQGLSSTNRLKFTVQKGSTNSAICANYFKWEVPTGVDFVLDVPLRVNSSTGNILGVTLVVRDGAAMTFGRNAEIFADSSIPNYPTGYTKTTNTSPSTYTVNPGGQLIIRNEWAIRGSNLTVDVWPGKGTDSSGGFNGEMAKLTLDLPADTVLDLRGRIASSSLERPSSGGNSSYTITSDTISVAQGDGATLIIDGELNVLNSMTFIGYINARGQYYTYAEINSAAMSDPSSDLSTDPYVADTDTGTSQPSDRTTYPDSALLMTNSKALFKSGAGKLTFSDSDIASDGSLSNYGKWALPHDLRYLNISEGTVELASSRFSWSAGRGLTNYDGSIGPTVNVNTGAELVVGSQSLEEVTDTTGPIHFNIHGTVTFKDHAIVKRAEGSTLSSPVYDEIYPYEDYVTFSNAMKINALDVALHVYSGGKVIVEDGALAVAKLTGQGDVEIRNTIDSRDRAVLILTDQLGKVDGVVNATVLNPNQGINDPKYARNYIDFQGKIYGSGANVGFYSSTSSNVPFSRRIFRSADVTLDNLIVYGPAELNVNDRTMARLANVKNIWLRSNRPGANNSSSATANSNLTIGKLNFIPANEASQNIHINGLKVDGSSNANNFGEIHIFNYDNDAANAGSYAGTSGTAGQAPRYYDHSSNREDGSLGPRTNVYISGLQLYANKGNGQDFAAYANPATGIYALKLTGIAQPSRFIIDGNSTTGDGMEVDAISVYSVQITEGADVKLSNAHGTDSYPLARHNSLLVGKNAKLEIARNGIIDGNLTFEGSSVSTWPSYGSESYPTDADFTSNSGWYSSRLAEYTTFTTQVGAENRKNATSSGYAVRVTGNIGTNSGGPVLVRAVPLAGAFDGYEFTTIGQRFKVLCRETTAYGSYDNRFATSYNKICQFRIPASDADPNGIIVENRTELATATLGDWQLESRGDDGSFTIRIPFTVTIRGQKFALQSESGSDGTVHYYVDLGDGSKYYFKLNAGIVSNSDVLNAELSSTYESDEVTLRVEVDAEGGYVRIIGTSSVDVTPAIGIALDLEEDDSLAQAGLSNTVNWLNGAFPAYREYTFSRGSGGDSGGGGSSNPSVPNSGGFTVNIDSSSTMDGGATLIAGRTYFVAFRTNSSSPVTWTLTDNTEGKVIHHSSTVTTSNDLFIVELTPKTSSGREDSAGVAEDSDGRQSFAVDATNGSDGVILQLWFNVEAEDEGITFQRLPATSGSHNDVKAGYRVDFPSGITASGTGSVWLPSWLKVISNDDGKVTGVEFARAIDGFVNGTAATVTVKAENSGGGAVYYQWNVIYGAEALSSVVSAMPVSSGLDLTDPAIIQSILALFGGRFAGVSVGELNLEGLTLRTIDDVPAAIRDEISRNSRRIGLVLPTIKEAVTSIKVFRLDVSTISSGSPIFMMLNPSSKVSSTGFFSAAADDKDYVFFDAGINRLTEVPSSGTSVYVAAYMEAGNTYEPLLTVGDSTGGGNTYVDPYADSNEQVNTPSDTEPSSGDVKPVSEDITPTSKDITPTSSDVSPDVSPVDTDKNSEQNGIDPYDEDRWSSAVKLSTAEALRGLLSRINDGSEPAGRYYALTVDIDLSGETWQGIGTEAHPFTGHFDGSGRTITCSAPSGFFGIINTDGVAVRRLKVRRTNASASGVTASASVPECVGGIAQKLLAGTIEECSFTGSISVNGEDSSAGGIVGELAGGTITNCMALSGSGIYADYAAGGIAGYVSGGEISECSSNARVDARYSGGIAGYSTTARNNINSNSFTEADYEVGNDASILTLTPVNQNVQEGSEITPITFSTEGIRSWSFKSDLSGLTSRDNSISGTIPYDTPAGIHTITINAVNTDGTKIAGQATLNVARINVNGSRNFMDYIFDVPAALRSGVTSFFGVNDIYQLTEGEIISETWQPGRADLQEIAGMNMRVILTLPEVRPERSGVYLLKLTLLDVSVGSVLGLHGISGSSQINSSVMENMEYAFFDETGREIKEVPPGKVVYVALRLSSGRTHRGVVTAPKELGLGTIEPFIPDEKLLGKIAEAANISADELNLLENDNIGDPQDPTQAMRDEMSNRESDVVGKMNTLIVSRDGYYVFKVTLSDDLYEQYVKGVKAEDLKAYVLHDNGEAGSAEVGASFITGLLNTWELLTLTGNKLEFGAKEFLMVGFLNAGTPFSVYLTKLILALLMGGCDAGLGLAGLVVVAGTVILILRRRR